MCKVFGFNGDEDSSHPTDGGSKDIQNIGILPYHYMASQTTRPQLIHFSSFSNTS